MNFDIYESYIASRTGNMSDCEDRIHNSENFIAVIDGTTSHSKLRFQETTSGQMAAKIVDESLNSISSDLSGYDAVKYITKELSKIYKNLDSKKQDQDTLERISASAAILNKKRGEIWIIGDCKVMIDIRKIDNSKVLDRVLADARSLYIEASLLLGSTIEDFLMNDKGREFIEPMLEKQAVLQNNPESKYWYSSLDGYEVPNQGVRIISIPKNVRRIALMTDGYPKISSSLKKAEEHLKKILSEDPLMYKSFKSTKGVKKGNISFDDRAFISIRVTNGHE